MYTEGQKGRMTLKRDTERRTCKHTERNKWLYEWLHREVQTGERD